MSKKIKIANKEEDASVSEDRYGFKGNKKKAYGFDLSNNDQYDINVLENIEDYREVIIEDDEKSEKKKKVDESQKHNDKKPSIADPVHRDTKTNNGKNDLKEDQKDKNIPKADPSGPESHGIPFLNKEDKEKRKDKEEEKSKEKEDESNNKHKLFHHKDNFADHNNKPHQDNNSKTSNHLPVQNHADEKKDKGDEKTGTVEKIAVNKESTDGYVQSLNEVRPIQFIDEVKDSPPVAHGLEVKESKKEEAKLPKLEQPTGLPLKGADTKDKSKEKSDPKDIKLQPEGAKKISPLVDEKHIQDTPPVKLPPLPPVNKETGDANEIKFILDTFPTHDKGLNSDFGPVPQINLDGQADPQQNEKFSNEATEQTTEEKAKADAEIKKDFGENNIFPTVKTEILESKHKFSQPVDISSVVNQDTSGFDEATKANFDQKALNKLQQDREKEVQKVLDGKDQKDLKIEKEHKLHNEKIEKETLKARKDQEKEQNLAKKSVDKHRQDWEAENTKVKSDFDSESDKKKKETKASIDSEVKKTDEEINKQVDDANAQVKKHTEEAEQKAKAEKAKADNQPKSFWDRISDAVSDLFDAIKSAINSIFDALRKLVKSVIELAKKAINKLIDYVRDAVIGLIKAFGEVLKALVKVALAAFPALRDKFIGFIDKAVNAACDAVNAIAEGLKKVVNFLLDALGKVIDMALAFYQAIVNLALDALQMIALGLLKVLKFLSQVGEKLKKFGGLIDSINEVYEHPEILETAAQQTIQPYIDKIPAETEKKLNEGLSAVGLTKHFKGIWKYLAPALSHLASNWWGEAKKMIWFLIWPFAEGSPLYEDAPKLVHLIPQIWKDVWNGDYSKAIDGCLEWMQALNMTLGAFAGWIAIAGVVVGAVIGGVAGAVGGAGVGAIPGAVAGAGAGLELAAAVGEGLLVSMMATESAVLTKAIYDLMTTKDDENKESTPSAPQTPPNENNNNNNAHKPEGPQGGSEQPQLKHYTSGNIKTGHDRIEYAYQRIANSVITLGIMGALFLLGAIGGKIAQGLSTAFKKIAAALDRAAPETMASVRNIASKVSSGVGRVTKPVKDFGEKYGDDFGRGQKWMEGKIDDVKGKFGFKKKGGRVNEEENSNNNHNEENENNQNNNEENKDQSNNDNNENGNNNDNNQDHFKQDNEVDSNSNTDNNSNHNDTDSHSENNNSIDNNDLDTIAENKNTVETKDPKVEDKPVDETPVDKNEQTVKDSENTEIKDAPSSSEGPISKLPEPVKESLEKLKGAGLEIVEDGNVIKILTKDGKLVGEIEDGVLRFKYKGYGGDIVMDPDKTTTVLGKFFEDIQDPDKGTRYFLGTDKEPLPVDGLPEGSFSRGEGKGSNPNGMNFLDIKEGEYNALMEKNIQKYLDEGYASDVAEDLGRKAGNHEFWEKYNLPFLEDSFKRGDNVRLVSDPKTFRSGTYAKELESIEKPGGLAEQYGYDFDPKTNTWKKIISPEEHPKIETKTVELELPDLDEAKSTLDNKSVVEDPIKKEDIKNGEDVVDENKSTNESDNGDFKPENKDPKNRPLESQADPVKDVLGPGRLSHPEEWNAMLKELEDAGVEIRFTEPGNEQLAYSPGLKEGQPGQLIIDPDASISALKHEFQHFLDDRAIGYGGMKTLFDAPLRYEWEFRAYYEEIKLMRQQKRFDVARELLENLRKEKAMLERDLGPVKPGEVVDFNEVKDSEIDHFKIKTTESIKDYKDVKLGAKVGSGGNKVVYEIAEEPDKVIAILKDGKPSKALEEEIMLLEKLSEEGLSTVEIIKTTTHEGRPALVMKRYAQGSKDVVKVVGPKVKVVGKSELLNLKSINDLEKIKEIMVSHKVKVDDLQFLIGSDGAMVIADPLDVFVGIPPSNKNIKMIDLLIDQARQNSK